jgi:hypothetical protein
VVPHFLLLDPGVVPLAPPRRQGHGEYQVVVLTSRPAAWLSELAAIAL